MHYDFQNLERMFDPDWVPTDQDVLHARLRTTGITETFFDLKEVTFRMMDVGGQRTELMKWIHYFGGVQCLLFLAALSGYDQSLLEDVNAIHYITAMDTNLLKATMQAAQGILIEKQLHKLIL